MKTTSTNTFNINPKIYMEAHFSAVMEYLCFGVNTYQEPKKSKSEPANYSLVKKVLEYSAKHPELIPGYTNLPKYQKDKQMNKDLKMFASDASETLDKIAEQKGSINRIAYAYALAFIENTKLAADNKVTSGVRVYRELKKEFSTQLKKAA